MSTLSTTELQSDTGAKFLPNMQLRIQYVRRMFEGCFSDGPLRVPCDWLPCDDCKNLELLSCHHGTRATDGLQRIRNLLSLHALRPRVEPIPADAAKHYCGYDPLPQYFERETLSSGLEACTSARIGQRVVNLVLHDGQTEIVMTRLAELFANTPGYQVQWQPTFTFPNAAIQRCALSSALIYQPLQFTRSSAQRSSRGDGAAVGDLRSQEVPVNPCNPAGLTLFATTVPLTNHNLDELDPNSSNLLSHLPRTADGYIHKLLDAPPYGIHFRITYGNNVLRLDAYIFDESRTTFTPTTVATLPFHPCFAHGEGQAIDIRQAETLLRSTALLLTIKSHLFLLSEFMEAAVRLKIEDPCFPEEYRGNYGLRMSPTRPPSPGNMGAPFMMEEWDSGSSEDGEASSWKERVEYWLKS